MKRLTSEFFMEWVKQDRPTIRPCKNEVYVGNRVKLNWECLTCGCIWASKPNDIRNGSGCPQCFGTPKKSFKEIQDFLDAHNNEQIAPNQVYHNNRTKIDLTCIKGHPFSMTFNNLRAGWGCVLCSKQGHKTEQKVGKLLLNIFPKIHPQATVYCPTDVKPSGRIRVDYSIPERNLIVEYHGYQHYVFPNIFHRTKKEFSEQIKRDTWLRKHCAEQKITLFEISYTEDVSLAISRLGELYA